MKKRLRGLEEFGDPLWSPPKTAKPLNWTFAGVMLFSAICFGLAIGIMLSGA